MGRIPPRPLLEGEDHPGRLALITDGAHPSEIERHGLRSALALDDHGVDPIERIDHHWPPHGRDRHEAVGRWGAAQDRDPLVGGALVGHADTEGEVAQGPGRLAAIAELEIDRPQAAQ